MWTNLRVWKIGKTVSYWNFFNYIVNCTPRSTLSRIQNSACYRQYFILTIIHTLTISYRKMTCWGQQIEQCYFPTLHSEAGHSDADRQRRTEDSRRLQDTLQNCNIGTAPWVPWKKSIDSLLVPHFYSGSRRIKKKWHHWFKTFSHETVLFIAFIW